MVNLVNILSDNIKYLGNIIKNKSIDNNNEKISIKNLEYKLEKFFNSEKKFKKNRLILYYNFNKVFSEIPTIPYFMYLFYSNFNYIVTSCTSSEWDEIKNIYNTLVKKYPNYKNVRMTEDKAIYNRRYMLLVTYFIFLLFCYTISQILYDNISRVFFYIVNKSEMMDSFTFTFVLFVVYLYFILGLYHGGFMFLLKTFILLCKIIYYMLVILFYILYYLFYIIYIIIRVFINTIINTTKRMSGGGINSKIKGGNINDFINNSKRTFDNLSFELVTGFIDKKLEQFLPKTEKIDKQCRSTSNIEKMLAVHNNKRNISEPVNNENKFSENIINYLPSDIKNNKLAKCLLKKRKKINKPLENNLECDS